VTLRPGESSRRHCATIRCRRPASFFRHATPGSSRKRRCCMQEGHRHSPCEARRLRCDSRAVCWRFALLKASNALRVPSAVPAAERSTSPTRVALSWRGCSGDSFGPVGHLGATDELEPHYVEQVLLRRVEVPVFAHPATLRGAYPIGQSTRLNAIPSAICRSG
jgi:hypothetical protein